MSILRIPILCSISVLSFLGCGAPNKSVTPIQRQWPKPGTVVASAEKKITEDTLNNFRFQIRVVADSAIEKGVYDVDVDYGPNFASGQFTMPKGGEHLAPIIKTGLQPYSYIIGFRLPDDTTFYEYYEISCTKQSTKMQYINTYSFE